MSNANGIITSPVSMTDVQIVLGDAATNLAALCTSEKINKWSRFKPVIHNNMFASNEAVDWWKGSNGAAGFGITVYTSLTTLLNAIENGGGKLDWPYIPPTGGEASAYRLLDFNGYNNLATSFVESWDAPSTITNAVNNTMSAYLNTRAVSDSMISWADIATSSIDLKTWRFGIAIRKTTTSLDATKWKASTEALSSNSLPQVTGLVVGGLAIGTYNIYPFFCSNVETYAGELKFISIPNLAKKQITITEALVGVHINLADAYMPTLTSGLAKIRVSNYNTSSVTISGAIVKFRFSTNGFDAAMQTGEYQVSIASFTVASGETVYKDATISGLLSAREYVAWFQYSGTYGTVLQSLSMLAT